MKSEWESADDSPGFLLWRVTLAWQRAMRTALAPHDLTHVQFVLLMSTWWLVEHDGPPTQQAVADHAGTDPMMTSQVLRKLADRDLLVRRADPADARARRLDLTAAGRDLLTGALADVERADREYFAAAGEDVAALVRGLRKLA
ncbi:MarR family winged helix-turn-helix transcriptional regulator [Labedaea rhizosphaerae]|uniref:DNA-binding MarR family transcriptional regulator n=1 Tax=Labedaea rhizosphaerae TaxID=598644 RepID=A0A4R6RWG1_LABRH|nr:MarR family winged helix-turn-helix transcriptional regulator [Labedaea rhizosphaerae]TDP90486.1 DNA-binding MarR family transcriptional regulator [Labedaea rhizosphaerae]